MRLREFHRNIKIRLVEIFFSRLVSCILITFMPIYLAQYFGNTTTAIIVSINLFIGLIMFMISGYYADVLGRKPIMVIAESLKFVSLLFILLANSPYLNSPVLTCLMMTVNSIAFGLFTPAAKSMMIDVSKPEQRKYMYTYFYWISNLAMAIGGVMGGFMFKKEFVLLMLILTGFSAVTFLLVIFFFSESLPIAQKKMKREGSIVNIFYSLFQNYKEVCRDRLFVLYFAASVLIMTIGYQTYNYIGLRIDKEFSSQKLFAWNIDGVQMVGLLRLENTILVVALVGISLYVLKKMKEEHALVHGMILFIIGYAVLAVSNSALVLIVAMFVLTIGELLSFPIQESYLADIATEDKRSSYMAVNAMALEVSLIFASWMIALLGVVPPIFMSGLFILIGIISIGMFYFIGNEIKKRKCEESMD